MAHLFLTNKFDETDSKIYVIDSEKIEELNVFETYGKYGQEIGHTDAGDYSIHNSYCDLASLCKSAVAEKFNLKETDFDLCGDEIDYSGELEIDEEAINKFIVTYEKEHSEYVKCKGFTYWNGQNLSTIITHPDDFSEANYEIMTDEAEIEALERALDEKEEKERGFGKIIYEGGDYTIEYNYCEGTWAKYIIENR